jgi:DNA-binding PadR family transcriptional regulator
MSAERGPVQPTATGYALLGLLSFGQELSGYELKQWADDSLRFFWSAPAMSQVYRELERLAEGDFVEQRNVVRDGTRATKVYRLAPEGERAVRAWLAATPEPPVLKHPIALRIFFGHLLDADDLRRAVEAHRDWCERVLADLSTVREGLGDDPTFRNAAVVAEWGLEYFRGDIEAVTRAGQAALDQSAVAPVAPASPAPAAPAAQPSEN